MSLSIDLTGSVAVVTGAARGIGASIGQLLAAAGAQVVLADLDEDGARATASSLGDDISLAVRTDVTDPVSIADAVVSAENRFGPVDLLVNNAFATTVGPFTDISDDDIRASLDVILLGSIFASRAVLPGFLARARGSIINIISDAGRVGESRMVPYSAGKAGLIGLTRAMAKEFGHKGIRVNGVSPGTVRTATTLDAMAREGFTERQIVRAYPLGRLGEPEDVAHAVTWLASPLAAWVTGQIVSVNGGYAMS